MNKIDVSVVLNIHREELYLRSTLLSLSSCAVEAQKKQLRVELVAVFDRSDEATHAVFRSTSKDGFCNVSVLEIDAGSLGLARNAGIRAATGEFIWTSDGDDLVSRNSIIELVKVARSHPNPNVAVFLDYLAAFGDQYHVVRYVGSEWLTAADFAYQHPYVSRIFVRKALFESLRYLDLKLSAGFAYEDWDLNARLFASGFEFVIAPDTVLFYRQRRTSLLRKANELSAKLIPHSTLFDPKTYRTAMVSAREKNADWAAFLAARRQLSVRNFARELMATERLVGYVAEASRLDPEVEPTRIENASSYCPVPSNPKHWGFQLERFYQLIGSGPFDDVLLLPWLKPGGAEKYIVEILYALRASNANRRLLVIAGQIANKHEWTCKLPRGTVFIDLINAFPLLDDAGRDSMLARALLAVAGKGSHLHLKASHFSDRMLDFYGDVLSLNFKIVYYRFNDGTYSWRNKRIKGPWGIGFLRRQLPNIDLLISDCHSIVSSDMARLGTQLEKYHVIYAQCTPCNLAQLMRSPKKRLLWGSRISAQKRPELLRAIATALRRKHPEAVIEVYGQVEENYQPAVLFDVPGVIYRGSFDGFENLPIERFDAFLYTSAFDGLPNIVLESLGAGLPVIAPDVGGIREAVIDGETGFLVPDLEDEAVLIAGYVDAVRRLYEGWHHISRVSDSGRRLIMERHGRSDFRRRVAEVFELDSCGEVVL